MANRYIPPDRLDAVRRHLSGTDGLITDVLLDTGFRLDDVMHLRVYHIRSGVLDLRERKTGHRRCVALSEGLRERCRAYARRRNGLSYAFPALRAGGRRKMHRTTYWRHFIDAVRRAGYGGEGYTPHSLRKVYAVRLFEKTGSLAAVQADLGHSRPEITMIYALSNRI